MTLTGLLIILTQQIIDVTEFSSHKPNTFLGWIKSFPRKKPFVSYGVEALLPTLSGEGHATVSIPADATIEKKVDFLLRQFTALDSAISRVDVKVSKVNTSLDKAKEEFQESVNKLSTTLNSIIASHVVWKYDMRLFGINITICGTVIQFFSS